MKVIYFGVLVILFSCNGSKGTKEEKKADSHVENINDQPLQQSLFRKLADLQGKELLPQNNDSIIFLILPIEASCPSCRDKTIDSIVKYRNRLDKRHFIAISGPNRKTINAFLRERDGAWNGPYKHIMMDTTDTSFKSDLADENPVIYYAAEGAVYRKVSCKPGTIKKDLHKFFQTL